MSKKLIFYIVMILSVSCMKGDWRDLSFGPECSAYVPEIGLLVKGQHRITYYLGGSSEAHRVMVKSNSTDYKRAIWYENLEIFLANNDSIILTDREKRFLQVWHEGSLETAITSCVEDGFEPLFARILGDGGCLDEALAVSSAQKIIFCLREHPHFKAHRLEKALLELPESALEKKDLAFLIRSATYLPNPQPARVDFLFTLAANPSAFNKELVLRDFRADWSYRHYCGRSSESLKRAFDEAMKDGSSQKYHPPFIKFATALAAIKKINSSIDAKTEIDQALKNIQPKEILQDFQPTTRWWWPWGGPRAFGDPDLQMSLFRHLFMKVDTASLEKFTEPDRGEVIEICLKGETAIRRGTESGTVRLA